MMFMRSCTPLTPCGILVKSSRPIAFCLALNGRWSEATTFRVSLRGMGMEGLGVITGGGVWGEGFRAMGCSGGGCRGVPGGCVLREGDIHALRCSGSGASVQ